MSEGTDDRDPATGGDWNVVVSVDGDGYTQASRIFRQFGSVRHSGFYNVFLVSVDDVADLLSRLGNLFADVPDLTASISRVAPAQHSFRYTSAEEFERKAREIVLAWVPRLAGCSFHVRFHRRGRKHEIPGQETERRLDEALLAALDAVGSAGRISFEDPDAVIDVETVGTWAGLSLWTRDDLARCPFLRPD